MKFKNYKSAIHNFAHSFQSVDYMKSGKLALNVLIRLKNSALNPTAVFDFVSKIIQPDEAVSGSSRQLVDDYFNWLPAHFRNHNCDINKLQKLTIIISADFEKAFTPQGRNDCKQVNIKTKTFWKADNRAEQTIEISQDEVIDDKFLQIGIQEL